ncbi:MAG TPA: RNA polymerase sigma-70 factor [Dinghuibacter sp.]|uniref:RNA polymerase sigma factor n=1 Tax=Dinghuibacter sp. TaxID=2024697 RepID=UPI002C410888|nr:RNA polymerase sigma-70 factor [Dinghuibacter sp.]HTJ12347.1 RNA polymerase sigma-70 factor [Dinghuibacter sp.]
MRWARLQNESEMLAAAAAGDEPSFRQLFDHYWDPVFTTALALTKSETLAEDLTQEVFIKVWVRRHALAGVGEFKDYLFILARNHIFNELRKKLRQNAFKRFLFYSYQATPPAQDDQSRQKETEDLINQAVAQLPPRQQVIYRLSRQQGMNRLEIARELRISANTVKNHMNKALQTVNNYLRLHI